MGAVLLLAGLLVNITWVFALLQLRASLAYRPQQQHVEY